MKIISAGLKDKNIRMQCECCQCVFELESREDFKTKWFYGPPNEYSGVIDNSVLFPEYIVACPICGHETTFAFDERDVGKGYFSTVCGRLAMSRSDWEERYKIKPRRNDEYDS